MNNITSRNELIFKLKRKCMERGFRSKLSMSTNNETKSLHVIFLCNKSGKSSLRCKNPSVRGLCPFLVLYERKSYIGTNTKPVGAAAAKIKKEASEVSEGRQKQYRATGQAYDALFTAPPPDPNIKQQLYGDGDPMPTEEDFKE